MSLPQILLILAGVAVILGGLSWGILHFRGRKAPSKVPCQARQNEITAFIQGALFRQGLSRREVSWERRGGVVSFTLKTGEHTFHGLYTTLQRELNRKFKGIHLVKQGRKTFLIRCGKRTTHRIAYIPPPAAVTYSPEKPSPKPKHEEKLPPPGKKEKAVKVAIVIDDIGNDLTLARELLNLPAPITLSIFPYAPHSKEIAREAREKGYDILMHVPMEPEGYPGKGKDPGPGALYVTMTPDELIQQLNKDLDQIPEICGINNHMGSRFTSHREGMKVVMKVLKARKKFFLDSRTSAQSVGFQVARENGIPTIKRDIFLDNTRDVKKIQEQLDRLVEDAKRRGYAVGIGHPHRATYLALKKAIPEYQKEGIKFVFVSSLVR